MSTPAPIPVAVPSESIHARAVRRALRCAELRVTKSVTKNTKIAVLIDDFLSNEDSELRIEKLLAAITEPILSIMPVPLIVSPRAEWFDSQDYRIPAPHLFEVSSTADLSKKLKRRVVSLDAWFNRGGDRQRQIDRANLYDWTVDHLRRLLRLEVESHRPADAVYVAISRLRIGIELDDTSDDWGENELDALTNLRERVKGFPDTLSPGGMNCKMLCELAHHLDRLPNEPKKLRNDKECSINLLNQIEAAFPRRSGVSFLAGHATRLKALVIDDDIAVAQEGDVLGALRDTPLPGSVARLGDFIGFMGLPVKAADRTNLDQFLCADPATTMVSSDGGVIPPFSPEVFDFFLVDLSFGEKAGEEPFGYKVIWNLKRVCPGTPVLVHSAFSQQSHIIRAIQQGADWYCRKGEAERLVDHLANHVLVHQWSLEKVEEKQVVIPHTKDFKSDDKEGRRKLKYLYSRLLRDVPGERIRVDKLAGKGGAVTVKAEKEVGGDLERVSPMVVKIGNPSLMRLEHERYKRFILPYIGNNVGRIDFPFVQAGARDAAIGYTFAGIGGGRSQGELVRITSYQDFLERTLRVMERSPVEVERLCGPLDTLLTEVLPKIHKIQPEWDPSFPFPNRFFDEFHDPACSYLLRLPPACEISITEISEPSRGKEISCAMPKQGEAFHLPDALVVDVDLTDDGKTFRKLKLLQQVGSASEERFVCFDAFPEQGDVVVSSLRIRPLGRLQLKGTIKEISGTDHFPVGSMDTFIERIRQGQPRLGIIHGDLHFENVLLDSTWGDKGLGVESKPWLIDFGWTRRDDISHDFAVMEEFVLTKFLQRNMFPNAIVKPRTEFLQSWLLSPCDKPPCLRQDPTGRLRGIYEILIRVRRAAVRAGVAGAFGDDKRYLSSIGLYLLWFLKGKSSRESRFIRKVCKEAVKIIQEYVSD